MHETSWRPLRCAVAAVVGIAFWAPSASAQISRVGNSAGLVSTFTKATDVGFDPAHGVYLIAGGDGALYGAFVNTSGALISSPGYFLIHLDPAGVLYAQTPRVRYCADLPNGQGGSGAFLVTWVQDNGNGNTPNFLHAAIIAYSPTAPNNEVTVVADEQLSDGSQGGVGWEWTTFGGTSIAYSTTSHRFLIVWPTVNRTVQGRFLASDGTAQTGLFLLGPSTADYPDLAWNSATDQFGFSYRSYSNTQGWIGFELVSASTGAESVRTSFGFTTTGIAANSVGVDTVTHDYVVGWPDGAGSHTIEFDQNGTQLASAFASSQVGTYDGFNLAFNSVSDTFLAVGHDRGGGYEVVGLELDGTGTPSGSAIVLTNGGGTVGSYFPRATPRPDVGQWALSYGRQFQAVADQIVMTATVGSGPPTPPTPAVAAAKPAALKFAATKAGSAGSLIAVTPAQSVAFTFVDSGQTGAWTAAVNQSWVQITNGAGNGNGQFTVGIVNPSNVIGGSTSLSATITISIPSLSATVTLPVTLTVDLNTSVAPTSVPFGSLDTPTNNATNVTGAIAVTGWALDDIGVDHVEIWRNCVVGIDTGCPNPVYVGRAAFLPNARPDVETAYPQYPQANDAGWGYLMLTNGLPDTTLHASTGGQGTFTLTAFAYDEEGHPPSVLGTKTITLANESATAPFGTLDTPVQGDTIPGPSSPYDNPNWYPVFGWAMSPNPSWCMDPTTYKVYIDGVSVPLSSGANWFTGLTRADLPAAFPGLCDSNKALAAYFLNASALGLTSGLHTLAWDVKDNQGHEAVVGSRYFSLIASSGTSTAQQVQTATATASQPVALGTATSLASLAPTTRTVLVQVGGDDAPWQQVQPDNASHLPVRMPTLGRIRLSLGGAVTSGYQVVGDQLRALPVGSTLDAAQGQFYWQPPAGFLGAFALVFESGLEQIDVDVTLVDPTTPLPAVTMFLDKPSAGSATSRSFTVAGWALDQRAAVGSGIDAVHVWAQRLDAPNSGPVFVGAATLGVERPDVANAYGAQFHAAGFQLGATLPPGTYNLLIFPYDHRTGQFEAAQVVRVTVRR